MFWVDKDNAIRRYFHRSKETDSSIERWLNRLAIMGIIEESDWHRETGKFFDIPECCREWYIYLTCYVKIKDPLTETDKMYGNEYIQKRYDYVICPKCRITEKYNE